MTEAAAAAAEEAAPPPHLDTPYLQQARQNARAMADSAAAAAAAAAQAKSRQCAAPGCMTQPNFNLPGAPRGFYCNAHKMPGMVNVVSKACGEAGCTKQPSFNVPGRTQGAFCSAHRRPGMVNVKQKRCAFPTCANRPSFNHPGAPSGVYCSRHKAPGMVRSWTFEFGEERESKETEERKGRRTHFFSQLFPQKKTQLIRSTSGTSAVFIPEAATSPPRSTGPVRHREPTAARTAYWGWSTSSTRGGGRP